MQNRTILVLERVHTAASGQSIGENRDANAAEHL